ncbi:MAG TPA: N-acetylglucosamine-6-phosphate deacetylase [Candidatus Limiplasma sp.]|nr:N-acetylglucosamine-6-phosphate deacetylase [Candidatus Limiplasma sp.]
MLIKNALVLTPQKTFEKLDVSVHDTIEAIGKLPDPADIDADGYYLIPGLIDIHTHGAMSFDFSDGDSEGTQKIAAFFAAHGITSYCATLMTFDEATLTDAVIAIRDLPRGQRDARCAGIYLEGPFLSESKRGAQAATNLHAPDIGMFQRLSQTSRGIVKMVGVAPELPGAMDFIREASKTTAVSLAHTAAYYETAKAGYNHGASNATHLFNAMNGLHHREPAVVGAAFDSGAYAELICDGIHIHPSVVRMTFRLFEDRLILVSDSARCAGMPNGNYTLGGQAITMTDGKATLPDGTIAGSAIHLMQAVQNVISWGISPADAVTAATLTPAKAIGMDSRIGSIAPGKQADMLLLNDKFELVSTIIGGEVIGK